MASMPGAYAKPPLARFPSARRAVAPRAVSSAARARRCWLDAPHAIVRLLLTVIALAWSCLVCWSPARAGTLDKLAVEAMFPPPWLVGEKLSHLPVWPVYTRNGQTPELQNYVFETVDLEPVAGYGGKPINVLVVMDRDGAFVTSRLLSHMEPIFRSETGTETLNRFTHQYQGVTVNHQVQVLGAKAQRIVTPNTATLHGVVAGTVTTNAINRSILEAASQVAHARNDPQAAAPPPSGRDDRYGRTGFNSLASARLIQPWPITHRTIETGFKGTPAANKDAEAVILPAATGVDLWLAFVGIPQAGRNLLDASRWRDVRKLRDAGTAVMLVLDGGRYPIATQVLDSAPNGPSTKATSSSASSRSGMQPNRGSTLELVQAGRRYRLEALPWDKGTRISGQTSGVATGAVARWFAAAPVEGVALDPLAPVEMKLDVWRRVSISGSPGDEIVRSAYVRTFEIPDAQAWAAVEETPKWLEAWNQRRDDLVVIGVALALLTVALLAQRRVAASAARLAAFRLPFLVFTLVFVGWFAQGQLTIVSLTSAIEAVVAGRSLEFLLADPVAVVLWVFTFATLLVWGRGTFCGWLCPFGALQELIAVVARRLGLVQRRLRTITDRWLKSLKYVVLALVFAAAALSPELTEQVVEVEPFKTAISMHFQRSWPYVAWAVACLAFGAVVYRGYCRYLCPLGAALAILGRLRLWRWIPRRAQCGTPCQTCRHGCGYQAIASSGKVDYAECFQCLDCVQIHDDHARCLPLVAARNGKTIPIRAVPMADSAFEGAVL